MTISSQTARNGYTGNSSTLAYDYTFKIFDSSHAQVTVRDPDTDLEYLLTETTHYSVGGVGDPTGGTITLVAGAFPWIDGSSFFEDDWAMSIRRVVPLTQITDIRNQGAYFPEVHEDEFDLLTMADQQQQDEIDRSVKLPETISSSDFDPTLPSDIQTPDSYLVVNSAGDGFSVVNSGTVLASGADLTALTNRVFQAGTYATLQGLASAAPTLQRFGFATDYKQFCFYCADTNEGDQGWFLCPTSFVGA